MTHDDDRSLTQALEAAREAGRRCALATIVSTKALLLVKSELE